MEALFPTNAQSVASGRKAHRPERDDRGFVRSVHCFREYHRLPFSLSKHAPQVIHFAPFTSMPGITMKRKETVSRYLSSTLQAICRKVYTGGQ